MLHKCDLHLSDKACLQQQEERMPAENVKSSPFSKSDSDSPQTNSIAANQLKVAILPVPALPTTTSQLEEYYRAYALHTFSLVLNEYPLKIKAIEAMKGAFNWALIASLQANTSWIARLPEEAQLSPGDTTFCIADGKGSPFLVDVYEGKHSSSSSSSSSSMIATNEHIHEMITRLAPYVSELADSTLQLSFAIQLLVPRYQEGNNFGLEVQAKAMETVNEAHATAQEVQAGLKDFYYTREAALRRAITHPQVADYEGALVEADRAALYSLCRAAEDLYSTYTGLHDMASKNIERLLRPRDEDSNSPTKKRRKRRQQQQQQQQQQNKLQGGKQQQLEAKGLRKGQK